MSVRVFLSHSSDDKDDVRRLGEDLRRAGLEVWLDEREIRVGESIVQKIQEGLNTTQYLALWLTRRSIESGWVNVEWQSRFADGLRDGTVVILPLLAEDCEIPRLLRDRRYADFRRDYRQGLFELLQAVGVQSWSNQLGMEFRLIPPGAFMMGSEKGKENERPLHQVSINRPFYLGVHVVTQSQWQEVMDTEPWKGVDKARCGDRFPAVNVTWYDAQQFLTRLGAIDRGAYYLPTEEEWEYAARAGTSTEFSFGDDGRDLRSFGWFRDMTQGGEEYAHEVGMKSPNPWGLYDVHGNVWEWTDSWYYGSYAAAPELNPTEKVVRGGGWDYPAIGARSAFRNTLLPTRTGNSVGLRLVKGS
jgi:formylglycine-generating enzyme required for sulfatase activity